MTSSSSETDAPILLKMLNYYQDLYETKMWIICKTHHKKLSAENQVDFAKNSAMIICMQWLNFVSFLIVIDRQIHHAALVYGQWRPENIQAAKKKIKHVKIGAAVNYDFTEN